MSIQIEKITIIDFGTINLSFNEQIILEYYGILPVKDFELTMIKGGSESLFVLTSLDYKDIIKHASIINPKVLN